MAVNALCAIVYWFFFPYLIACMHSFIFKAILSLSLLSVCSFHCCEICFYLSAAHDASLPSSFRIFGGFSELWLFSRNQYREVSNGAVELFVYRAIKSQVKI